MTTVKDVARVAGVSTMTVSRVLTGNGYVSEGTRTKVEHAVRRLGYVRNQIASSLATGRTMSLGMIVPDISAAHFSEMAFGAETTATKAGYILTLCNTNGTLDQEKHALSFLQQARVDGIIMAGARLPDSELLPALAQHRAFVSINHPVPPELGGNVVSKHAQGMYPAVEHLVKLGRKRIAFMMGPKPSYSAKERMRGFLQAMKAFGRTVDPELIVPDEANLEDGYRSEYEWFNSAGPGSARWSELRTQMGERGAFGLLTVHPEVDAIVCFNDNFAVAALRACVKLGRRVPDDVAIVGCDDIPVASQVTPALTTQRIPRFEMGKRAVELLIGRIDGERQQKTASFPHEFIVRASAPALA